MFSFGHCLERGGPLPEFFGTFSPNLFFVYFFTNANVWILNWMKYQNFLFKGASQSWMVIVGGGGRGGEGNAFI